MEMDGGARAKSLAREPEGSGGADDEPVADSESGGGTMIDQDLGGSVAWRNSAVR